MAPTTGEGNGTPLQYSCLESPMDGGAWQAAVHGVARSWTRLSDFTFTFHFHALEKEMATHSSIFVWRIPGMGEPGGLLSMGLHRVGYDWSNLAAAAGTVLLSSLMVTGHPMLTCQIWECAMSSCLSVFLWCLPLRVAIMVEATDWDTFGNLSQNELHY